jgi:ribonuclease E
LAETTEAAAKAAKAPSGADIERAAEFVREPILLDGEGPKTLAPGTARRKALDAALAELDAGLESPSIDWRRNYSLLLGLERLLADEQPKLNDGAELNPHQVDALSGTLAALISDIEEGAPSNGRSKANGKNGSGDTGELDLTAPAEKAAGDTVLVGA